MWPCLNEWGTGPLYLQLVASFSDLTLHPFFIAFSETKLKTCLPVILKGIKNVS